MQESSSRQIIPGTLTRFGGAETIISSGIPSLDELFGDGIPTGSLVIIDEDTQGLYSRVLLKYFLAEGIVNRHNVFVASQEIPSQKFIEQLPMLIEEKPIENEVEEPNMSKRKMKIAFRYDNLPTKEKEPEQRFGHYYDLSAVMLQSFIRNCKITYWDESRDATTHIFHNRKYYTLLSEVKNALKILNGQRNVLRIGIHSLASPLWQASESADQGDVLRDLNLFLYTLRMMVQSSKAVAYVTIPVHLYDGFARCLHLSDIYVRLQAFAGTELAENKYLSDYHGFFHVDKLSAKNAFKSKQTAAVEYVFKLRRKKFVIEMLHLPPDIETSDIMLPSGNVCGSKGSKLDF